MKKKIKHLNISLQFKMKKYIFLFITWIFLLLSLSFCVAFPLEAEKGSSMEIGNSINPDFAASDIVVENMLVNTDGDLFSFSFTKSPYTGRTGRMKFSDNDLNNIMSTEGKESSLKLDSSGKIVEADLWISDSGSQIINFGEGNSISAKPGDRVIYKNGDLTLIPSSGRMGLSEIKSWDKGDVFIDGKNFKIQLPNSKDPIVFSHGNGLHYDGKNLFVQAGEPLSYNGASFTAKKRVNFYTDGLAHEGEDAISFGKSNLVLSCGNDPDIGEITIQGESDYYRNLLKNTEGQTLRTKQYNTLKGLEQLDFGSRLSTGRTLTMSLTTANSYIDFGGQTNLLEPSIPTISAPKGYNIQTGKLHLVSSNGRTEYLKSDGQINGALDVMILDTSNEVYDKALQIGENSNLLVNFKTKESKWTIVAPGMRDGMLRINNLHEKTVFYRAMGSTDLQNNFNGIKKNLVDASSLLDNAIKEKYKGQDLSDFFAEGKTLETSGNLNENALKYYLTPEEIKKTLGDQYSNFNSNLKLVSDMTFFKEVLGQNEQGSSAQDLQYYGYRTSKSIRGLGNFKSIWSDAIKWLVQNSNNKYKAGYGSIGISSEG